MDYKRRANEFYHKLSCTRLAYNILLVNRNNGWQNKFFNIFLRNSDFFFFKIIKIQFENFSITLNVLCFIDGSLIDSLNFEHISKREEKRGKFSRALLICTIDRSIIFRCWFFLLLWKETFSRTEERNLRFTFIIYSWRQFNFLLATLRPTT